MVQKILNTRRCRCFTTEYPFTDNFFLFKNFRTLPNTLSSLCSSVFPFPEVANSVDDASLWYSCPSLTPNFHVS